jgi:AAA family ATP:ADP antiporter
MFFCILFNYTILRDTKDVLVVTAPGSGAEIIPFLKTWCVGTCRPELRDPC